MLSTRSCSFKGRNGKPIFCPEVGANVHTSLVTFTQPVWPAPAQALLQTFLVNLFFSGNLRTHLYGRCHTDFTKSFSAITSDLCLVYFVPQRDFGVLCCVLGIEFIIARTVIKRLCCVYLCLK